MGVLLFGIAEPAGAGDLAATAAQAQGAGSQCSLATLHGTYQFAADGFLIGGTTPGPIAYAGFVTYDGKGGFKAALTLSINGTITHNLPITGTYTVNPDCTGSDTELGGTVHYDYFIRPDGSRITAIETDPGSVTSLTSYRVTDK